MRLVSGRDCGVSVIAQVSTRIWGSVGILDFAGGFHILDSQPIFVDKSLADEAFIGSAVEEGLNGDLLLCCLQCDGYAHCVVCRAGL